MTDTRVSFDPRGVRTVNCSYVLESYVVHVLRDGSGVTE
jgi:hypothetical protein